MPGVVDEDHDVNSYSQLNEVKHEVEVMSGSKLFKILGQSLIWVNSGHHQGVGKLGGGLILAAKSKEGIVEAIEGKEQDWFLLGVQWHPEARDDEVSAKIFTTFSEAVR